MDVTNMSTKLESKRPRKGLETISEILSNVQTEISYSELCRMLGLNASPSKKNYVKIVQNLGLVTINNSHARFLRNAKNIKFVKITDKGREFKIHLDAVLAVLTNNSE